MSDDEFLDRFHAGSLASFRHYDHVRLAWLAIRRHGLQRGGEGVVAGIRELAGASGKYHETITRFWLRLVAHAIRERPELDELPAVLAGFPLLLDPSLPRRHWSDAALERGGAAWVEPDLRPLPS